MSRGEACRWAGGASWRVGGVGGRGRRGKGVGSGNGGRKGERREDSPVRHGFASWGPGCRGKRDEGWAEGKLASPQGPGGRIGKEEGAPSRGGARKQEQTDRRCIYMQDLAGWKMVHRIYMSADEVSWGPVPQWRLELGPGLGVGA